MKNREKFDWFWFLYGILVIILGMAGIILTRGDIFLSWFFVFLGIFAIFKTFWDLSLENYIRKNLTVENVLIAMGVLIIIALVLRLFRII